MEDGRSELRHDIFPVSADFLRMEAEHGIAVVGVLATEIKDRLT